VVEQPVVENASADEGVMVSESQPPSTVSGPPSVVWGAAAAGLLGAVTAYAIEQKRRREEEEEQKAAVAAAFNADQRAADVALAYAVDQRKRKDDILQAMQQTVHLEAKRPGAGLFSLGRDRLIAPNPGVYQEAVHRAEAILVLLVAAQKVELGALVLVGPLQ
jgi:hypothetical protein